MKKYKIFSYEYILVFLVIIVSARAIPFFSKTLWGLFIVFIVSFFFDKNRFKFSKKSIKVFLVLTLFVITYLIKYRLEFDPIFTVKYFLLVATARSIINILGFRLLNIYQVIIIKLVKISLVFYLLQILFKGLVINTIVTISHILFNTKNLIGGTKLYGSILIYTVNTGYDTILPRNAGFAWEPGPFSMFIVLAILFTFSTNNFKINKNIIILIIGLITTQSTTGFITFFIVLAIYAFQKNKSLIFIYLPIFLSVSIFLYTSLPFLQEKITNQIVYSQTDMEKTLLNYRIGISSSADRNISIGRFSGFMLNLLDFYKNPFIGFGGHYENTIAYKYNADIHSTTGLGNWLAQFGLIGMILMLYSLTKSLSLIGDYFNIRGKPFLILIFLSFFFGFNILDSVLFMSFILFYPFYNNKIIHREG